MKEGIPLVLGRSDEVYTPVLLDMARANKVPAIQADTIYTPVFHTLNPDGSVNLRIRHAGADSLQSYTCDLSGNYQQENLITALCSLNILQDAAWSISPEAIARGFARVAGNTGIQGRWQTVGSNPRSICDTAHNRDGIAAVLEQIEQVPHKKLHMIWGMVNDKDLASILPLLPRSARYYFTPSSVPRSMDATKLQAAAAGFGLKGSAYAGVEEAYRAAIQASGPDDLIFTGGSTFVVADLLSSALIS
jgi:dihydrofolate synthase/folylpolyglutamate synthase